MQKWEYIYVVRQRGWNSQEKSFFLKGNDWKTFLYSRDPKKEEWNGTFLDLCCDLGEQGWELVSLCPISDYVGNAEYTGGIAKDYAGFTSSMVSIFKRPKD